MDRAWTEPVLDPAEVRFRLDSVVAGVVLTLVLCTAGGAYALLHSPHPVLVGSIFGLGAVAGVVVWLLPWERIVRSGWREPAFLAWSIADLALIAVASLLDGLPHSPLALIFFVPAVFASTSYPLPSVIAVGALGVAAYLGVGLANHVADDGYTLMFVLSLSITSIMSAWQARNHDRRRQELARMSRTDPLTGALNRRGFSERAAAYLADATRNGFPLALISVDLDHFKQVNDTLGHDAGDQVLEWVAERLVQTVRAMDAVGRLGGDEFAVLLYRSGEGDAINTAERIRAALSGHASASLGVAVHPRDGDTLDDLLRCADARLYRDKEAAHAGVTPSSASSSEMVRSAST